MWDEATTLVFGKRALNGTQAEAVEDWAVAQLMAGHDTPTLRMLAASASSLPWSDVETQFEIVLTELNISPPTRNAALWDYALLTAKQILSDRISPARAVVLMYRLLVASDYQLELDEWAYLEDLLSDLHYKGGYSEYAFPGVTVATFPTVVKDEARKLLSA